MFDFERIFTYWTVRVPESVARKQTIWERNRAIGKMLILTGCTVREAATYFKVNYQTALDASNREYKRAPVSKFLASDPVLAFILDCRNKIQKAEQIKERRRKQKLAIPGVLAYRLWVHNGLNPTPQELAAIGRERFLNMPYCGFAMLVIAEEWLALHNLEMSP
jgi:hypothetical protein